MFGGFPIPLDSRKKYTIKTQTFTANTTWIKPPKLWGDVVWVTGIGGGGGGGGTNTSSAAAGGGGSGCFLSSVPYNISTVTSVAVVIGPGGAGGFKVTGTNGTDSSFGTLLFKGGGGGCLPYTSTTPSSAPGGSGGQNGNNGNVYTSGTGGGSPYGLGGLGIYASGGGNAAGDNTGAGGGGSMGLNATGGNGGSGRIDIWWIEEC